jgi:hypothetical protein
VARDEAKIPWQTALPFQRAFDPSVTARESTPVLVIAGAARIIESGEAIEVVQESETVQIGLQIDKDDARQILVTSGHPKPTTVVHLSPELMPGIGQVMSRVHSGGAIYFAAQRQAPELPKWIKIYPVEPPASAAGVPR